MRAKQTVDTLEKMIDKILDITGTERTILCMTIDSILDKFDDWVENSQDAQDSHPCPKAVSMFITEMKAPLYSLAGLNDFHTDNEDQCVAWLRAGTHKMKMKTYLDL